MERMMDAGWQRAMDRQARYRRSAAERQWGVGRVRRAALEEGLGVVSAK